MKKELKQFARIKKLKGNMRLAAEGWKNDYEILIATILSARSLDETTIKIGKILFKKYSNAKKLSKASLPDVRKIIKPVNFYRNKSKSIANCAKMLEDKYMGKVPHDYSKLIELPGVGNKTANVFLSEHGHDRIAVDTHLFYISRYLGWSKSKKPEIVEKDLERLFPKKMWKELNPVIVKFGKKYTSRKEKNRLLDEIKRIK